MGQNFCISLRNLLDNTYLHIIFIRMDTKLTLKLEEKVIKKAKIYAKNHGKSLSELVENYFKILVNKEKSDNEEYSYLIKELSGVIKSRSKIDHKKEYTDYLEKKYR